jgi:methanethiol oxidase
MVTWRPDPSFYPSPRMAMQAPPEKLAYVALLNPNAALDSNGDGRPDAIAVFDVDADSETYGQVVGRVEMPNGGDELHHFGWNACSSALCPYAPHPHIERRYLIVPGLRSSRMHIVDTKPNPREPRIVKVIEPEEVHDRTGYSRPHTIHCGPEGIYVSALGAPDGDGPGGVFIMDHESFDPLGAWEVERGPQYFAYDFWWHLGYDTMITSEWGTPNMIESGLNPEILMQSGYGHRLHLWDLRKRRHQQALDLGDEYQIVLELRPAHNPNKTYGFAGVVVNLQDLSSSIWLWHRQNGLWGIQKVIDIPAEPADPDQLPPALKGFAAVPPLVSDINLSLDDRVLLGGIVRKTAHPKTDQPLNGGPQMVELSRDGRRVYFSNSLYAAWDAQFYPEGIHGWIAKVDVAPDGSLTVDSDFFIEFDEGERPHQIRLEGGDSSSDSYCYVS